MVKYILALLLTISLSFSGNSQKIKYSAGKWNVDRKLLFEEFSKQFNHLRDSFNLPRLSFGKTADTVAWKHSQYMAETGDYQHGMGSLSYGEKITKILGRKIDRPIAENILILQGFNYPDAFLKHLDRKELEKNGNKATVALMFKEDMDYSDLVQESILIWLQSPGHRKTLLSEKYTEFSIAAVCDAKNSFYITYEAQK